MSFRTMNQELIAQLSSRPIPTASSSSSTATVKTEASSRLRPSGASFPAAKPFQGLPRKDFPNIAPWTEEEWKTLQTTEKNKLGFLVRKDGTPVKDKGRRKALSKTARRVFEDWVRNNQAPTTAGKVGRKAFGYFQDVMCQYEEFLLADSDWKLLKYLQIKFSDFIRGTGTPLFIHHYFEADITLHADNDESDSASSDEAVKTKKKRKTKKERNVRNVVEVSSDSPPIPSAPVSSSSKNQSAPLSAAAAATDITNSTQNPSSQSEATVPGMLIEPANVSTTATKTDTMGSKTTDVDISAMLIDPANVSTTATDTMGSKTMDVDTATYTDTDETGFTKVPAVPQRIVEPASASAAAIETDAMGTETKDVNTANTSPDETSIAAVPPRIRLRRGVSLLILSCLASLLTNTSRGII
jgi:hypothetical protein